MGVYWSFRVKRPEVIVYWGIYRWVKHPAYIGSILLLDGLGRLLHFEPQLLALGGVFYTWRAWREERLQYAM